MITYREIRNDEFKLFKNYFVADYGNEIADNYGYSIEKSLQHAQTSVENSIPGGILPLNSHLMCIERSEEKQKIVLGYLWYEDGKDGDSIFINDFYIFEQYRNMGYGKSVFEFMEKKMMASGIKHITLRVAYTNDRAMKLYQALGFRITGYNMIKNVDVDVDS